MVDADLRSDMDQIETRPGTLDRHRGYQMVQIRRRGEPWSEVFPWRLRDAVQVRQCKVCSPLNLAVCQHPEPILEI